MAKLCSVAETAAHKSCSEKSSACSLNKLWDQEQEFCCRPNTQNPASLKYQTWIILSSRCLFSSTLLCSIPGHSNARSSISKPQWGEQPIANKPVHRQTLLAVKNSNIRADIIVHVATIYMWPAAAKYRATNHRKNNSTWQLLVFSCTLSTRVMGGDAYCTHI